MRLGTPSGWLAALLLASALAATGCSTQVQVKADVPPPLVERLPLRAAIQLPPDFISFVHREEHKGGSDWEIDVGAANRRLIESVTGSLFEATREVTSVSSAAAEMPGLDLILVPRIESIEFSVPAQSATDQYAVWIRYNIDVHDRAGALITTWSVTAYGQSGKDGLGSGRPLERAALRAVRDAAATIATGFASQKKIRRALLAPPADSAG